MNTVSDSVGQMIRKCRCKAGLSIESLAYEAGISTNFLGDVERGRKKPSLDTLESVLNALNLSFVEFFSDKDFLDHIKERSKADKIIVDIERFSDSELTVVHNIIKQLIRLKK